MSPIKSSPDMELITEITKIKFYDTATHPKCLNFSFFHIYWSRSGAVLVFFEVWLHLNLQAQEKSKIFIKQLPDSRFYRFALVNKKNIQKPFKRSFTPPKCESTQIPQQFAINSHGKRNNSGWERENCEKRGFLPFFALLKGCAISRAIKVFLFILHRFLKNFMRTTHVDV